MGQEGLRYFYRFNFQDGTHFEYEVNLDGETFLFQRKIDQAPHSDWTKLEFCQCQTCPLKKEESPHCPVALNLQELVLNFEKIRSYVKADIEVLSHERAYQKQTDVQTGLFSLFGLIMASSGCPKLDFLRPLVKFHLPFASIEETLFRVVSLHFLSEYFGATNLEESSSFKEIMDALKEKYLKVEEVNQGMLERIHNVVSADADKNAFVALNIFIQFFSMEYDSRLDTLASIFVKRND